MASSPPGQHFLPEVMETSARSSRRSRREEAEIQVADRITGHGSSHSDTPNSLVSDQMKPVSTTRPFLPQPIETSLRSNKHQQGPDQQVGPTEDEQQRDIAAEQYQEDSEPLHEQRRSPPQPPESTAKNLRKFAPEPVETSIRTSRRRKGDEGDEDRLHSTRRRYVPEPLETTTRSNRRSAAASADDTGLSFTRRRFAPEPTETTTNSNHNHNHKVEAREGSPSIPTRRKFAPEPVETTVRRRRKPIKAKEPNASSSDDDKESCSTSGINTPRKFAPELLETARGFFRRGDSSPRPSGSQSDHPSAAPRYLRPALASSDRPSQSAEAAAQIHESRFSAANLARKQTRQHSFIVPDLPCIQSDSSEENSAVPSLSTSSSASSEGLAKALPPSQQRPHQAESREGYNGDFQSYMLTLAAQAAEKQLIDQAMAAYPNQQVHEPVHHFAVEDTDEEPLTGKLAGGAGIDPKVFRRESAADLDWHMMEMRRHHAQLEDGRKVLKEDTAGPSRFSAAALSARQKTQAKKAVGANQRGVGLAEMRNAASPPMLGDDLIFPTSVSPKMTRCDVDQVPVPRRHDDEGDEENEGEAKLWTANIGVQNSGDSGLWMGFCQRKDCDEQDAPTPMRSGLQTPAVVDHVEAVRYGRGSGKKCDSLLPLSPTHSNPQNDHFIDSVDQMLNEELGIEHQIEAEFHHGFITQIYNYLSLGYPSLAHKYDHELSKISRISVEELRKDDDLADAKGYVGAPEGAGLDEHSVKEGKCARWTALRLYIHEWARQQPDMADRTPNEWGVRARRGSWAF